MIKRNKKVKKSQELPIELIEIIFEYAYNWIELFKLLVLSKNYNELVSNLIVKSFQQTLDKLPRFCIHDHQCDELADDVIVEFTKEYRCMKDCESQLVIPDLVRFDFRKKDILASCEKCGGIRTTIGRRKSDYDVERFGLGDVSYVGNYEIRLEGGRCMLYNEIVPDPSTFRYVAFNYQMTKDVKIIKMFCDEIIKQLDETFRTTIAPANIFIKKQRLVDIEKSLIESRRFEYDGVLHLKSKNPSDLTLREFEYHRCKIANLKDNIINLGGIGLYRHLCVMLMNRRHQKTLRLIRERKIKSKRELHKVYEAYPKLFQKYGYELPINKSPKTNKNSNSRKKKVVGSRSITHYFGKK